jgi:hypothetical protein
VRSLVRILLAGAFAGLPALSAAAPRSIADCERIEAADAYNRCLASFGPPGRSLRLAPPDASGGAREAAAAPDTLPGAPEGKKTRLARRSARHASRMAHEVRAKRIVFSVEPDRAEAR